MTPTFFGSQKFNGGLAEASHHLKMTDQGTVRKVGAGSGVVFPSRGVTLSGRMEV